MTSETTTSLIDSLVREISETLEAEDIVFQKIYDHIQLYPGFQHVDQLRATGKRTFKWLQGGELNRLKAEIGCLFAEYVLTESLPSQNTRGAREATDRALGLLLSARVLIEKTGTLLHGEIGKRNENELSKIIRDIGRLEKDLRTDLPERLLAKHSISVGQDILPVRNTLSQLKFQIHDIFQKYTNLSLENRVHHVVQLCEHFGLATSDFEATKRLLQRDRRERLKKERIDTNRKKQGQSQ